MCGIGGVMGFGGRSLSGGLDSSSIVRTTRALLSQARDVAQVSFSALQDLDGRRGTIHRRGRAHERGTMTPAPTPISPAHGPKVRRALWRTLTVTSLPGLLRDGDRNNMAVSREARLPCLDHRLVEFAYTLPPSQLVRGGASKVILRRAMSGIMPDAVRDRMDKVGVATPERDWLLGPLRPRVEAALADPAKRGTGPADRIDAHWRRFVAGHGCSGTIWRLANLEIWMAMFLDGRSSRAAG